MHRGTVLAFVALLLAPRTAWPQGDPLGPEFRVNTYTTGHQGGPLSSLDRASVTSDSSGNFVVVWSSLQDGSSYGVFGQRYDASGALLGPEFRVNSYTSGSQSHPDIAAEPSGSFVVVWQSDLQDGSNLGIFGQRYAGSGVPLGSEFRVNSYTTGQQGYPSVAADSSGGFVIAWDSYQDGSGAGVFGQRFASSGGPLGSEFRVNTATSFPQRSPSITSDAAGNFLVVWQGSTPPGALNTDVFGQRYSASGAPLGAEFRVNTITSSYQFLPAVAADASGNFVVVWFTFDAFSPMFPRDVSGQRYASTGAPLGSEFRVNTTTYPAAMNPSVAMDSIGDFVVVWDSYHDGSLSGVFGQRFASAGAPLGTEFLVNTYTAARQLDPGVASDSAGKFVVVWRSDGQDGSQFGVFGQRYSMIVPVELMRFGIE